MKYIIRYKTQYAPITTEGAPFCADPIGIPDTVVLPSDIIEGTLQITMAGALDTPTSVTITYLPDAGDSTAWVPQPARQSLIGVNSGAVEDIPSVVELPGVRRLVEALRKANSRLTRLQFPGQYSWQTFDAGIKFQKGDVVRLPDFRGLNGQFVRILSIEMVEIGIYQISAEHYSRVMYADQIVPDGDSGVVPVGLILPYDGTLPGGWEDYNDADEMYIMGAGGDQDIGEVEGLPMPPSSTLYTEDGGGHVGTKDFYYSGFPDRFGGSTEGLFPPPQPQPSPQFAGIHNHPFSVSAFDPDPYRRNQKLMKKTGGTSITIPAEAMVFGRPEIYWAGLQRIIEHANKMFVADSASGDAGQFSLGISAYIGLVFSGQHKHTPGFHGYHPLGDPTSANHIEVEEPPHHHGIFTGLTQHNLRRYYLPTYGSNNDFQVRPGMIGMWDGNINDLPENWHLCDGDNGTIDLRDYFIAFAGADDPAPTGNNTVRIVGTTPNDAGHNHKGDSVPGSGLDFANRSHAETIYHNHQINASIPWRPDAYALAFIMYLPPPEE